MTNFLNARWENLIMSNYTIDPKVLLPYLPNGVELDFYNGETYVSLVGFLFKNTRIFQIPIPCLGTFEEINLRFYVTRKEGNNVKRGVVFINETVPNKFVAFIANSLYNENYTAVPTKHEWSFNAENKNIQYQWKINKKWNSISVMAGVEKKTMIKESFEEFIFEHYYGYSMINKSTSEEYKIEHARWQINEVIHYTINCDFEKMYGKDFDFLNNSNPKNVILAEGSSIAVKWKRTRF